MKTQLIDKDRSRRSKDPETVPKKPMLRHMEDPERLQNQVQFMRDQVERTWQIYLQNKDAGITGRTLELHLQVHEMARTILRTLEKVSAGDHNGNDKSLQKRSDQNCPWCDNSRPVIISQAPAEPGRVQVRCRYSGCTSYFMQHNKKRVFCSDTCRIAAHRQMK